MDYRTGCDLLALNAETVVKLHAANISTPRREGQTFSGWYLEHRIAGMGYNKQGAADALGVSRTFYYNLINGDKNLSDDLITTAADALDFTVAELLVVRDLRIMEDC